MEKLYWYPLAMDFAGFINECKDNTGALLFDGVPAYVGSMANGKTFPCIEITWDSEEFVKDTRGIVSLWVDICLKNNSRNPADAYALMHQMQNGILNVLPDWERRVRQHLGIATKTYIPNIISDGDVQRPICQSRIILQIEWRTCL